MGAYAVFAYAVFLLTAVFAVGFLANLAVPTTIDSPQVMPTAQAIVIDLSLLFLFGLQHSAMARPWFKRLWMIWVPEPIERSTYVLASSVMLMALFIGWQPVTGSVWAIQPPWASLLWCGYASGWLMIAWSSSMISHGELFGLSQAWHALRERPMPVQPFCTKWLYKIVRHPIMLGFLIAFWSVPRMTVGHLLFSLGMTIYILIGLRFEERDLERSLGDDYRAYQSQVPMLLPRVKKRQPGGWL